MAASFNLGFDPVWYIADQYGRPLGSGYLATFSNLNQSIINPVYQDPAGMNPWPYVAIPNVGKLGIQFDANGSQGPFYFAFDTAFPSNLYYLEVYDADGVLQWTLNNYSGTGSGGGSIITTAVNLDNIIINDVMWRNLGPVQIPVGSSTFMVLAPGAHAGFTNKATNTPGFYTGSDICFVKNNASATDFITFPKFNLGNTPFSPDVTPVDYFQFDCTGAGSSESSKYIQFPITKDVQNLSNQQVSFAIWAKGNSGSQVLTFTWFQFFGDGAGASSPAHTLFNTSNLTNAWQKIIVTPSASNIPPVSGQNLGAHPTGNDAIFLQIGLPINATCSLAFTKPAVYLGSIIPTEDYQTYDMIDAVINAPRTGDIKTTVNTFGSLNTFGYVLMNDGTIGSTLSLASTRANTDTFSLYNLIYNNVLDTWAPVTGGRSGDAVVDFNANKPIALTKALGRVFAGTLPAEIPQTFTVDFGVSTSILTVGSSTGFFTGVPVVLTTTGTLPTGLSLNTVYYIVNPTSTTFQLALTVNGTPVTFSDNGTGTNTVTVTPYQLGEYVGEFTHAQLQAELPNVSPIATTNIDWMSTSNFGSNPAGILYNLGIGNIARSNVNILATTTISPLGSGTPFNVTQPTTFMNVFIKL